MTGIDRFPIAKGIGTTEARRAIPEWRESKLKPNYVRQLNRWSSLHERATASSSRGNECSEVNHLAPTPCLPISARENPY